MTGKEKQFKLRKEDIKNLFSWDGPMGCIASDRITVDGKKVGYMYRAEPTDNPTDSGWCFMAGDESEEYTDNPDNSAVYSLNTICNYDPDIIPLLNSPIGSAFIRDETGKLVKDELPAPTD